MVIGGLAGQSFSCDYKVLELSTRAEVVDLRADVAEGLLIAKINGDISKLIFRRDKVDVYDFVGDSVPQSFESDCSVFAAAGIIAVR